eukprot:SAG31_NODE_2465_length_5655_cov_2.338553_5_plen_188_part_00
MCERTRCAQTDIFDGHDHGRGQLVPVVGAAEVVVVAAGPARAVAIAGAAAGEGVRAVPAGCVPSARGGGSGGAAAAAAAVAAVRLVELGVAEVGDDAGLASRARGAARSSGDGGRAAGGSGSGVNRMAHRRTRALWPVTWCPTAAFARALPEAGHHGAHHRGVGGVAAACVAAVEPGGAAGGRGGRR